VSSQALQAALVVLFIGGCAAPPNPEPRPPVPPPKASGSSAELDAATPAFVAAGACKVASQGFCIEAETVAPDCAPNGEAVKSCAKTAALGSCAKTNGSKTLPLRSVTYYYTGAKLGPSDRGEARAMCESSAAGRPGTWSPLP
jgi:hypothetical protein